jgi:hypothetical protein
MPSRFTNTAGEHTRETNLGGEPLWNADEQQRSGPERDAACE